MGRGNLGLTALCCVAALLTGCTEGAFTQNRRASTAEKKTETGGEDEGTVEPQIVTGTFLTCLPLESAPNAEQSYFGCRLVDGSGRSISGTVTRVMATLASGETLEVPITPAADGSPWQFTVSLPKAQAENLVSFAGTAQIAGVETSVTPPPPSVPTVNSDSQNLQADEENIVPTQRQPESTKETVEETGVATPVPAKGVLSTIVCPAKYLAVLADTAVNVSSDFCVSAYEMKKVNGDPQAIAADLPWVAIKLTDAKAACRRLGNGYSLITNAQWMAIARAIENVGKNWSSGQIGVGQINRGHSDEEPANSLSASDNPDEACFNTGETCSSTVWHAQKRTHVLPTGGVIWDFAGNVHELVDWTVTADKAVGSADPNAWMDLIDASPTAAMPEGVFRPKGILRREHGIGGYFPGAQNTGGTTQRGGSYGDAMNTGIYALALDLQADRTHSVTGFRCVFSSPTHVQVPDTTDPVSVPTQDVIQPVTL